MESVGNMKVQIIAKAENIMLETTTYRDESMILRKIRNKLLHFYIRTIIGANKI